MYLQSYAKIPVATGTIIQNTRTIVHAPLSHGKNILIEYRAVYASAARVSIWDYF